MEKNAGEGVSGNTVNYVLFAAKVVESNDDRS
jgi:hypothetical protein